MKVSRQIDMTCIISCNTDNNVCARKYFDFVIIPYIVSFISEKRSRTYQLQHRFTKISLINSTSIPLYRPILIFNLDTDILIWINN